MLNIIADERGTETGYVIEYGVTTRHSMLSGTHHIHIVDKSPKDNNLSLDEIVSSLENGLKKHEAVVANCKSNYPDRERVIEWHEEFVLIYESLLELALYGGFDVMHKNRAANVA